LEEGQCFGGIAEKPIEARLVWAAGEGNAVAYFQFY
jgi:hypothetical protein